MTAAGQRVLHVGVAARDVRTARSVVGGLGRTVTVDGDGWEAWGERPGTDVNDGGTVHVQVLVGRDPLLVRSSRIVSRLTRAGLLVPMRADYQAGVVAAVTAARDCDRASGAGPVLQGGGSRVMTGGVQGSVTGVLARIYEA